MDFPTYQLKEVAVTKEMIEAIGIKPLQAFMRRDLVCVLETEKRQKTERVITAFNCTE